MERRSYSIRQVIDDDRQKAIEKSRGPFGIWVDEETMEANESYRGDTTKRTGGTYVPESDITILTRTFETMDQFNAYLQQHE